MTPPSSVTKNKALFLRSAIKSTTVQLDNWDTDQAHQLKKRRAANVRFTSFKDRLRIAKCNAKLSFPLQPSDPICSHCKSPFHPAKECDIADTLDSVERHDELESVIASTDEEHLESPLHEDPSTSIHRATVHRLYLQACNLHKLLYPCFCPGPHAPEPITDVSPVSLAGPDYLAIAISKAAYDYQALPGIDPSHIRRANLNPSSIVAHLHCSKAFPISFVDFCHRIALHVEDLESDAPSDL
jgi:hypothetical protein